MKPGPRSPHLYSEDNYYSTYHSQLWGLKDLVRKKHTEESLAQNKLGVLVIIFVDQ